MKYLFYTLILLSSFSINSLNAQLPESGLIGYYPFTENATDRSGKCVNGIVNGADLTIDRFNYADRAYHFEGTTNSYIEIPGSSFANNEYSFSAWVQTESIPVVGDSYMILSLGGDDFKDHGFFIRNEVWGTGGYNTDNTSNLMYSQNPPVIGQWTHLVVTRSKTKAQFYVDGQLANELNYSASLLPFYSNNMMLTLSIRHNLISPFKGDIDDVRIYNRALTNTEVGDLYNEHLCYENIKVTDTLVINANITSYKPVNYQINIKVYPNPTADHLIIDAGNIANLTGYSLKITNSGGIEVFQSLIDKSIFNLDMNQWKGFGLYVLYLYDPKGNIVDVKKIVLQ
jgi:hypothetical protein